MNEIPQFNRYIGIDYSGAETADSSCKGLRVYVAEGSNEPTQVLLPSGQKKYWTRRGLAEWLCKELDRDIPTLVGIDHGFSFPLAYFEKYRLSSDWQSFLEDFHRHWPTDAQHTYVCFIREDPSGRGLKRTGERSWLRLTERWTPTAKSVFGFGVQGEVATSTHAGLPWLLYLRKQCKRPVHFWPFDGWEVPEGRSVVAEVYPSLWTRRFPKDDRDGDEQTAYAAAVWLQRADRSGSLGGFLSPSLTPEELGIAEIEGWIPISSDPCECGGQSSRTTGGLVGDMQTTEARLRPGFSSSQCGVQTAEILLNRVAISPLFSISWVVQVLENQQPVDSKGRGIDDVDSLMNVVR